MKTQHFYEIEDAADALDGDLTRQAIWAGHKRAQRRAKGQCADCGCRSKAYRCPDCKPVRVLLSKRTVSKTRRAAALKRWRK